MKKMKKVLIIDDLAFMRRVIFDIIDSDNRCDKPENILKINMATIRTKVYSKVLLPL